MGLADELSREIDGQIVLYDAKKKVKSEKQKKTIMKKKIKKKTSYLET